MKAVFLCWRGERRTRGDWLRRSSCASALPRAGRQISGIAPWKSIFSGWQGILNPNRSLDTPCPFLIGEMRLSGILPASVRILLPATPRRSPLRLRLGEKHAAWHKRAIFPKSDDRFGFNSFLGCPCFEENPKAKNRNGTESQEHNEIRAGADGWFAGFFCLPERSHGGLHVFLR